MDRHERGVQLIKRGLQYGRLHQLESGVLCLTEGLSLIDDRFDARLTLCAHHNLALYLAHLNLPILARSVMARARPLYRRYGDAVMKSRFLWLQGTVERIAANYAEAAEILAEAQRRFDDLGYERQASHVLEELEELRKTFQDGGETA